MSTNQILRIRPSYYLRDLFSNADFKRKRYGGQGPLPYEDSTFDPAVLCNSESSSCPPASGSHGYVITISGEDCASTLMPYTGTSYMSVELGSSIWLPAILVGPGGDADRQPDRDGPPRARLLQAHPAQGSHHRRRSGRHEEHCASRQGKEEHVALDELESERLIKEAEEEEK
ncbi:hypothetical protein NPIL_370841 [Nephila pilipes]|uniref:Uncharacterized protein n=1 Tax=Nephila pilipes TaxID=299642 RepID=A0A8X6PUZ2_NEPPI|nr:hypothetical protein NPIL_370841 [Nephila pilipes]